MSDTEKSDVSLPTATDGTPAPSEPAAATPPAAPPAVEADAAVEPAPRIQDLDKDLESELATAMGGLSEKDLYGEPGEQDKPTPAETAQGPLKGKVLAVRGGDVFVDVPGGRCQGVLPVAQFAGGPPAVGTVVEFHVEGYDEANGLLLLSRRGAAVEADWSSIAVGMIVEGRVKGTNKGGLTIDVNGIRGFMPISQIDLYRVEHPEEFVNQRLRCLVTEVKPAQHNLVVSRRALLEQEREEARQKLWQELAAGQVRSGVVRSVRDFGAFVDLGGVDGLLHISEMSWTRVKNPAAVVQPGQTVNVVVLKVDREHHKVSLGLKQLTPSPWDNIEARYPLNTVVKGQVTRLMDFGAFVELEPGIEGLIHISELAPQRVRRVGDIVQPGQDVQVMVLRVDPEQHKISLSLKAALPREPAETVEDDEETETKSPRSRQTPLRGGLGEH